MGIVISVNGNSAGDGFLVAPDGGRGFPASLNLKTDDGSTVNVTLDATPNGAGIVLPAGSVSVGPGGTDIPIQATAVSNARKDTVINVHSGGGTTTFELTSIRDPQIGFRGRFEARFATDGDYYNNPRGTDGGTPGHDPNADGFGPNPGWTWALEGEPDFIVGDGIPTTPDKPVGRVVRFNNPVALRPFAAPVATTVNQISGSTLGGTEVFAAGDPVLGATVNLGPNTYLAANSPRNLSDPPPFEPPLQANGQPMDIEGFEPMAIFECHIDGFFSGKPATLADRPKAGGFGPLDAAEKAIPQFIRPSTGVAATFFDLPTFEGDRLTQLQNAYNALSPADQAGTVAGRNLKKRIDHLTPFSTTLSPGYDGKEEYTGQVNDSIVFQPNTSSVVAYLANFTTYTFFAKLFTFHSDELDGYVHGSLTANTTSRLVKDCVFITDRNTFSKDEVDALLHVATPAVIPAAFYIEVDGFRPGELGISASDLAGTPSVNPTIAPLSPVSGMSIGDNLGRASALLAQDPSLPATPQRFTWVYPVTFTDSSGFVPGTQTITLTASIAGVSGNAQIQLNEVQNVYEVDGPISWLSSDTRVFMVTEGESWFNSPNKGHDTSDTSSFITAIINNLNNGTAGQSFDSLPATEDGSTLALFQFDKNGKAVFNFALSRVRYRALNPPDPTNVRVFFRLCPALSVSVDYDLTTTYRRSPVLNPDGQPSPVLGVQGGNLVTIPFFAKDRIDTTLHSMDEQTDPANVQTVPHDASGNEVQHYFGCWLDINQSGTKLFPLNPAGDGPYTVGLNSIFDLVRNQHQCMLTEIAFDPEPITGNPSPAVSDKLAQRNLSLNPTPNPGNGNSRRIASTFELKPTPLKLAPGESPDELLIDWGNTPGGATAQIYIPAAKASDILAMEKAMYGTQLLSQVDDHTIGCKVGSITYVPIPPGTDLNYASLLTLDLAPGARRGQLYRILVRQVTNAAGGFVRDINPRPFPQVPRRKVAEGQPALESVAVVERPIRWRQIRGSFQISIPVSTKDDLLQPEEQLYSMILAIQETIPASDRWSAVFNRYVTQIGQRVEGFGGNPATISPSPTGVPKPPKGRPHEEHERRAEYTGKVKTLIFDRYGAFEGFVLETEEGERTFKNREPGIERVVYRAFSEGILTTVFVDLGERHEPRHISSIALRSALPRFER
jgi:hypothetical protein